MDSRPLSVDIHHGTARPALAGNPFHALTCDRLVAGDWLRSVPHDTSGKWLRARAEVTRMEPQKGRCDVQCYQDNARLTPTSSVID
jgi:hypothetical protein